MADSGGPSSDRGSYLTQSRVIALERQIASSEARVMARIDQLERQVADVAALPLAVVKAQAMAMFDVLKTYGGLPQRPPREEEQKP